MHALKKTLAMISKAQLNEGLNYSKCRNADPLVVKTIRLRFDKFLEWNSAADLNDIKVGGSSRHFYAGVVRSPTWHVLSR